MLQHIIDFSIRNKLIVAMMVLGLIAYGALEVTRLPIDAVPDITDNQVQIITIAPSLGATDIERLITFPIEQANANIPGTKNIRSFSRFGLSLVTIVFKDDVNIYLARQQVSERLVQIQGELPSNIQAPTLGPVSTGLGEIYQYVVRPKKGYESKYSTTDLRTIQDWIVRRQLLGTEGVADVSSFGGYLKQWEVVIQPDKLKASNISIGEIFNALESNNQNAGGSYIERGPTALFIRTEGLLQNKTHIENIPIKQSSAGFPMLVKDVATVREGSATRFGAMCFNDQGEVAGAVVMMLKGENSSKVIDNVKSKIAEIQETLPEGIVIEPFLDRTKMVNNAISTVEKNLAEGALIVVFILILFLGQLRAGLLVASVIPLAMLFAVIMMNIFGVSGNLMSLGALDFGLIIDGAVIIVEAVLHQLHSKQIQHKLSQEEKEGYVKTSASRMMSAAVFGQLIILIVYLPILSLEGIEGKMFKPMAQTVAFAILGAFLLSLTYVPMMSALLLKQPKTHRPNWSDRVMMKIEHAYGNLLHRAVQHKAKWIGGSLILFVLAIFTFSNMGGEFIPELEEGDFAVDTRVLTGSNLQTTIASTQQAAKILLDEFPEVEKVVTKIGSGEIPTDPMPIEASDLMIILKDKKEWTSATTFDELAEKMGARMASVPGITTGFQFPVQMRFNELMTGARQDVVCKIYGENLDTLSHYAAQLGAIVNTIDGAKDLYVETVSGMPQIVVNYRREELARHGIAIDQVNAMVEAAFAGKVTGQVYEGEKRFDLAVKLDTTQRKSLQNVQQLLIDSPNGLKIPLSSLAEVEIVNGPYQIQRDNTRRRIIVGFNVRGRDVESLVTELQQKVKDKVALPSGYSLTYGGAFENLKQAVSRLMIAVPIALLLILLLLYFAFKSLGQSLLIYSAIPLSAIGGVFALWMRDLPFSISAGVGFIALFGVAVLNGIVLLSEINRLYFMGNRTALECVMEATKSRLRPVLMTASVASLGFLPMALSNGAGAEVQRPLATVVIGGLLTATVLTLFVLPMLYLFFQNRKEKKMKINKVVSLFVIGLVVSSSAMAQDNLELEALVLRATNESTAIQAKQKKVEEYETLANIKAALDATNISAEYGQVNSAAMDHRLVIDQSINSIKLYKAQRERYLLLAKENTILLDAEKKKIRQIIEENFYHTQILLQQEKILNTSIQNMEVAVEKMKLRFEKGESAAWEVSMIEEQLWKLNNRFSAVKQQMAVASANIQAYVPDFNYSNVQSEWDKPILMDKLDASQLSKVENVLLESNKTELVKNDRASLSGQRLPVYHLGVAAMTIQGYQNTEGFDVYYGNDSYFYTVQAGVSIPLFGANKRKLQSNAISLSAQSNQESFVIQKTQKEYEAVYFKTASLLQNIEKYEQRLAMSQSDWSIINLELLDKGEISIIEWIALQQWRNDTQLEYLQTCIDYSTQLSILHTYSPIQ